jgi:predicted lipid carrier protein YhbT
MGRNHPNLFAMLAECRKTRILVELTDPPRRFLLQYGGGAPTLRIADDATDVTADAELKGGLEAMMALLEARVDGDALFFTRELTVSGDTAAVVTLRNILDRETISVLDEATSLFGPLRRMARAAIVSWERRATRLRAALAPPAASGARAGMGEAEAAELREQIEALKTRLSKIEAHQRRKEGAAA